jgi:hypothetical protein
MKKIITVLAIVTLFACTREPEDVELIKHMLVQTEYNEEKVNATTNVFNDYTTFVLQKDTAGFVSTYYSDTIVYDNPNTIFNFVKSTINAVATTAEDRGFERVESDDDDPDFAIKVILLHNFSYSQYIFYPNYYSGYYGYYGGYWGPIVNTYSSNYMTMVIQVVDIKNSTNNQYEVIWSAYIGDILAAIDDTTRKEKVLEAVNQAFEQSPYFSKN